MLNSAEGDAVATFCALVRHANKSSDEDADDGANGATEPPRRVSVRRTSMLLFAVNETGLNALVCPCNSKAAKINALIVLEVTNKRFYFGSPSKFAACFRGNIHHNTCKEHSLER